MSRINLLILIILICFIALSLSQKQAFSEESLDNLFSVSISKDLVKTTYKYTVSDISPEWPKILFTGFSLAAIYASSGETIEVEIREQDNRTHIYSVNVNSYFDFFNDRISLTDFLRKIYKKVR